MLCIVFLYVWHYNIFVFFIFNSKQQKYLKNGLNCLLFFIHLFAWYYQRSLTIITNWKQEKYQNIEKKHRYHYSTGQVILSAKKCSYIWIVNLWLKNQPDIKGMIILIVTFEELLSFMAGYDKCWALKSVLGLRRLTPVGLTAIASNPQWKSCFA